MDLQPGAALADQLRHVGVKQGDALESEIVLREKLRDLAFNNPAPSWMEGSAKVAKRAPKLVLTDEQKLQRQTKHIGRILRAAIRHHRKLGGKTVRPDAWFRQGDAA